MINNGNVVYIIASILIVWLACSTGHTENEYVPAVNCFMLGGSFLILLIWLCFGGK